MTKGHQVATWPLLAAFAIVGMCVAARTDCSSSGSPQQLAGAMPEPVEREEVEQPLVSQPHAPEPAKVAEPTPDPEPAKPKHHTKKRRTHTKKSAPTDAVGGASMAEWERAVKERPSELAKSSPRSCCKTCRSSQACGDSCISWSKTCHKGAGCACQG